MKDELAVEEKLSFNEVFERAKNNDRAAVESLFAGFLSETETVRDCGYLGVIGYLFPDRSFWCLTDKRMCGLQLRRGGRMRFVAGFSRLINSMTVRQPSLIVLWVVVGLWLVFAGLVGFATYDGFGQFGGFELTLTILLTGLLLWATRWVVRIFYRLTKTGCTFWVREGLPVYLFADRHNVHETQKLVRLFTDGK